MNGPCMCGDLYCHSCGPAQGNSKCGHCGKWSMDGGCDDPEACNKAEAEWVQAEYEQWQKMEADAAEWERQQAAAEARGEG